MNSAHTHSVRNPRVLLLGCLGSLAILLLLVIAQAHNSKILDLEIHWLGFALIPVLVALVVGRYIERFKGFGLELETTLQLPVSTLDLTAADIVSEDASGDKGSLEMLFRVPWMKKQKMRRLKFTAGRKNYYNVGVVEEYFRQLPNLEHLEIQDPNGGFVGFLRLDEFLLSHEVTQQQFDTGKIDNFIGILEANRVQQEFGSSLSRTIVTSDIGLVELHIKMTEDRSDVAAIENAGGVCVGVVYLTDVHKRMADTLTALRKTTFQ